MAPTGANSIRKMTASTTGACRIFRSLASALHQLGDRASAQSKLDPALRTVSRPRPGLLPAAPIPYGEVLQQLDSAFLTLGKELAARSRLSCYLEVRRPRGGNSSEIGCTPRVRRPPNDRQGPTWRGIEHGGPTRRGPHARGSATRRRTVLAIHLPDRDRPDDLYRFSEGEPERTQTSQSGCSVRHLDCARMSVCVKAEAVRPVRCCQPVGGV